jgi:hypothetical protein
MQFAGVPTVQIEHAWVSRTATRQLAGRCSSADIRVAVFHAGDAAFVPVPDKSTAALANFLYGGCCKRHGYALLERSRQSQRSPLMPAPGTKLEHLAVMKTGRFDGVVALGCGCCVHATGGLWQPKMLEWG